MEHEQFALKAMSFFYIGGVAKEAEFYTCPF